MVQSQGAVWIRRLQLAPGGRWLDANDIEQLEETKKKQHDHDYEDHFLKELVVASHFGLHGTGPTFSEAHR
jgi:hypothetical protein